jgi:Rrf2 family protein
MIELALIKGEGGLYQKELVERQCMPNKFMDAVIHSLKVAGLIVNVAGKKSGYKLSRSPESITVYDIYRAFEPELYLHFCLAGDDVCPRSHNCASHCFFFKFNNEMETYMRNNTLEMLSDLQKQLDVVS